MAKDFKQQRQWYLLADSQGDGTLKRALILASILSLVSVIATQSATASDISRCQCTFSDSTFEAYGSNAACSAYSRKNQTSCEISFGGLGTDQKQLQAVLGFSSDDVLKYQSEVIDVLINYLDALKKNDQSRLNDPSFMGGALVIFLRGSYLRDSVDFETAKRLEGDVQSFSKLYATKVVAIFAIGDGGFSETLPSGATFSVTPQSIVIESNGDKLVATYPTRQ